MEFSAPSSTATLTADYMEFRSTSNVAVARGHVVLISSQTRVEADEVFVDISSRTARASGHVHVTDGEISIWAENGDFMWGASTGVLHNGYLESGTWRLWGREMHRIGPDKYMVKRAAVTNCELNPPHYHFRGRRGVYTVKRRITLHNGGIALERTPVFLTPFYTKSLVEKRWSLQVDPGQNSRNGLFAKSILTYKFTPETYGRIYWDHYQKTGNGWGAEYNYFTPKVQGSLYGYRINDRIARTERWNARAGHWQQLKPRWSLQGTLNFLSDSDFNNVYFRDDYERIKSHAESEAAVTYQSPYYTSRLAVEQDQVFDPTKNRFVRQKTTLPQLSLQTSPLLIGASVYATMNASFLNQYVRPSTSPDAANPVNPEKDLFKQTGDTSLSLSRTMRLGRNTTLVPSAGFSETWASWTEEGDGIDPDNTFIGRGFTGLNLRQRFSRSLDVDVTHSYRVRWAPNSFKRDHAPEDPHQTDQGLEANIVNLTFSYRPVTSFWARAYSGYDLRVARGETIESARQKITPPVLEMSFRPLNWIDVFYRQKQLLYPSRRPESTQFSFRMGRDSKMYFDTNTTYSVGQPGQIQVRNGAAFNLTRGWWLEGGILYNLKGPGGIQYEDMEIVEKKVVARRDFHCWTVRVETRERPGVNEIFFRIDLKSNLDARRDMTSPQEEQYYPAREKDF